MVLPLHRARECFFWFLILGTVLTALPLLFAKNALLAGICNACGFLFFLAAERSAATGKQAVGVVALLLAALLVRYLTTFGYGLDRYAITAALLLICSVFTAAALLLDFYLRKSTDRLWVTAVFALVYTAGVAVNVLLGLGNLLNPAGVLLRIPLWNKNLVWLGELGLLFCSVWLLALVAAALTAPGGALRLHSLLAAGALCAVLLAVGAALPTPQSQPDFTLRVAVATCREIDFMAEEDPDYTKERELAVLENALQQASDAGAELLVLSEEFYETCPEDWDFAREGIARAIRTYQIPVLLTFDSAGEAGELSVNRAVFYSGEGEPLTSYTKTTLVPCIEKGEYQAGEGTPPLLTYRFGEKEVNLSFLICFDINNSFLVRRVSDQCELLLVPSWDWDTCNLEQRNTWFRAVELQTTLLKHTYDGFTYVADPLGRCTQMLDFRGKYEAVEVVEVPIWKKAK